MPKGIKDKAAWREAKKIVEKEHGSLKGRYGLVMHIYEQKTKGKTKKGFAHILMERRRDRDIHLSKAGTQPDSFTAYAGQAEIHKHKNVLFLSRGDDWGGTSHQELAKSLFEIANHCLDDSDFVSLLDPEFLKSWTNGEMEIEKSLSEIEKDREFLIDLFQVPDVGPFKKSLTAGDRIDLVHKALECAADNDLQALEKALIDDSRDGKYLKRVLLRKGGISYIRADKPEKDSQDEQSAS